MGELSAQTLAARGVLGYVVDGGSRDTDLVLAQGFPVFCSFLTPSDVVARWIPDRYGEPVTIGEVTIVTGDYLLGDRDGVVIIPQADRRGGRWPRTEEVVATESEMRARARSAAWIRSRPTTAMASSDQDGRKAPGRPSPRAVMRLSPRDNVAVALRPLKAGETVMLDGVALTSRAQHRRRAQARGATD